MPPVDPWPERLWQVLIVEDDQRVTSIYRRTVAGFESLEIAGTVTRGEDALAFLGLYPATSCCSTSSSPA